MSVTPNSCEHREAWLHGLISAMRPIFAENGAEIPANIRVSCGFPSQRGLNGVRNQRIGECWADTDSKDGSFEIFVSPTLANAMRVAGAVAHELIHASVGLAAGHQKPFKRVALAIGLTGKMSATQEGDAFKRALEPILEGLGPYPHAELDARKRARLNGGPPLTSGPKKQGTRLLKAMCPLCNYTVRVTKKWVDEMGPPLCPAIMGGVSWNSGAYSPKTGLYYKVGNEWCITLTVQKTTPITEPQVQLNIGAEFKGVPPPDGPLRFSGGR